MLSDVNARVWQTVAEYLALAGALLWLAHQARQTWSGR